MFKKRQAHVEGMVVGSDRPKREFHWPKSHKKNDAGQVAESPMGPAASAAGTTVKKRRRPLLFASLLVGALMISAGLGYWWTNRAEKAKEAQEFSTRDTSNTAAEVALFERKVAEYPKNNLSDKQKQELAALYNALGAAYINNNQQTNGVKAYEAAAKLAGSIQDRRRVLTGLAISYTEAGKKDEAIKAYEELITIERELNGPSSEMDIKNFQREIERLRNGQQ